MKRFSNLDVFLFKWYSNDLLLHFSDLQIKIFLSELLRLIFEEKIA